MVWSLLVLLIKDQPDPDGVHGFCHHCINTMRQRSQAKPLIMSRTGINGVKKTGCLVFSFAFHA